MKGEGLAGDVLVPKPFHEEGEGEEDALLPSPFLKSSSARLGSVACIGRSLGPVPDLESIGGFLGTGGAGFRLTPAAVDAVEDLRGLGRVGDANTSSENI